MSVVGKPGYKETAVGWIPQEWNATTLGAEVESIVGGGTPSKDVPEYWAGDIPWASVKDFVGTRLHRTEDRITEKAIKESASNLIPAGTLLTPTRMALGRVAVFDCDVAINQDIKAIFPKPSLRKEFLFYWFQLNAPKIEEAGTGSTVKGIRLEVLREFDLLLPPSGEQQKIAAILTAVDDKLDVIARQISATQTLKQGLMQNLFTRGAGTPDAQGRWHPHTEFQDTELGQIPLGWSVKPIGSVAKESRARNAAQLDDRLLSGVSKELGLVPMRDRVKGVSTDRCRLVVPDAFAYNPMRINIGSIARNLHDHSVMVSPDYVVFSTIPEQLLTEYLDHFRRSDVWRSFVGRSGDGGVRIRIYFADLARLRLAVPPLQEQQRIVEVLDGVNDKLETLTTKQTHYQSLKRGLMQKLLTGVWRVRVEPATA